MGADTIAGVILSLLILAFGLHAASELLPPTSVHLEGGCVVVETRIQAPPIPSWGQPVQYNPFNLTSNNLNIPGPIGVEVVFDDAGNLTIIERFELCLPGRVSG